MSWRKDSDLGMHRYITRRDFGSGAVAAVGGASAAPRLVVAVLRAQAYRSILVDGGEGRELSNSGFNRAMPSRISPSL